MLTQENRDDLATKGYTVVLDVLTESECDHYMSSFHRWLGQFPPGTWPQSSFSLIQKYHVGHMEQVWEIRLKAYPVFSQLWKTDQLLTSMDAIAIGRPPEEGNEHFWEPEQCWLHSDQSVERIGLHAYQGGVYLEDCSEDDWTFEVVEGSHNHFVEFMDLIQKPRCTKVSEENLEWFSKRGCQRKRVPCPKGGLILWDSRLLHANARPVRGRRHPDRWRFVVFVCMTPAAWATPKDLETKVKAYNSLCLTGHWPSNGIITFSSVLKEGSVPDPCPLERLPEVATTETAQKLAGVIPYDPLEEVPYIPKFDQSKLNKITG